MTNSKTFAYGTLGASTDTFLLSGREHVVLLDIPFSFDSSLENKTVSVIGTMGVPASSTATKFIVEKIAGHDAIARIAHEIYQSGHGGSADDNWFRAERELLGI